MLLVISFLYPHKSPSTEIFQMTKLGSETVQIGQNKLVN